MSIGTHSKVCDFCYSEKTQFYSLYKVILKTDKAVYELGMQSVLERLSNWVMKRMLHLSASQIVLLRPDILHEFFKEEKKGEHIVAWMFKEHCICFDCFGEYRKQVPER